MRLVWLALLGIEGQAASQCWVLLLSVLAWVLASIGVGGDSVVLWCTWNGMSFC